MSAYQQGEPIRFTRTVAHTEHCTCGACLPDLTSRALEQEQQRNGLLRGELWTLRHAAARRHWLRGKRLVETIDRILNRDREVPS